MPFRCIVGWHKWPKLPEPIPDGTKRVCECCNLVQFANVNGMFNLIFWEATHWGNGAKDK